jgi:hypothetical protein
MGLGLQGLTVYGILYGMSDYKQTKIWRGYPLDTDTHRWCSRCQTWKRFEEFSPDNRRPGSMLRRCKPCQTAASTLSLKKSGQYHRWSPLTQAEYEEKLAAQGGGCAICGSKSPGKNRTRFARDHDHRCCPGRGQKTCGKCLRALLCHDCNVGLGDFHDNPKLLRKAAEYLEEHQKEEQDE